MSYFEVLLELMLLVWDQSVSDISNNQPGIQASAFESISICLMSLAMKVGCVERFKLSSSKFINSEACMTLISPGQLHSENRHRTNRIDRTTLLI